MPIAIPRFDDRRQPRGKDGDDFQQFVWDALRTGYFERLLEGRYLRPFFTAGNDGAIDHLAVGADDRVVFESKFFGKNRKGNPTTEWTSVANKLGPNLRDCANGDPAEIPEIYSPWFATGAPIKGYWFCTSGTFSPGAQETLKTNIKKFFEDLGAEVPALAHLQHVDVEVLAWNDFDGLLKTDRVLCFRWFDLLPSGLMPLKVDAPEGTFRKFLEGGTLKFFSRAEFNRETETKALERINDESTYLTRPGSTRPADSVQQKSSRRSTRSRRMCSRG